MTAAASIKQLRHVVQAAGLAPSVLGTQPWRFVVRPQGLELHADPTRRLAVLDPDGRQRHLSCGATLFHARAAARAFGLDVAVQLLPDAAKPELLADLVITEGAAPNEDEIRLASAILHRHSFSGAFDDRPVPDPLVDRLRLDAERECTLLHEVSPRDELLELEVLLARTDADEGQRDFTLSHPAGADGSTPTTTRWSSFSRRRTTSEPPGCAPDWRWPPSCCARQTSASRASRWGR